MIPRSTWLIASLLLVPGCSVEAPAGGAAPIPPIPPMARTPESRAGVRPEPRAELSAQGAKAYRILRDAERFTDDAIYYGGITPVEVRAWRWLMREPQAGEAFAQLAEDATLPGRLFALCGLFATDPAGFGAAIEPYRGTTATVCFQTGCEGLAGMPVAELIESPRAPAVRLASRDETVRQWARRTGVAEGYHLDILGGGYPSVFREAGGWHAIELEDLDELAAR